MVRAMAEATEARWLVLIHQIPPSPSYLRVKIGRRLQGLGSVAVKNSVYVLPRSEQSLEDFQWVRREIVAGGGEASVCEARFVEGLSDASVESLFNTAREADYAALAKEVRALQAGAGRRGGKRSGGAEKAAGSLFRLRKRLAEVVAIDVCAAGGRDTVEGLLAAVEAALAPPRPGPEPNGVVPRDVRGRTWVTRTGVHVDRMASAWLIRRFIDPDARFRFVGGHEEAVPGELRFDMFEAEFTHEGELCTFEVLLRRFGIQDKALARVGEIVHDIDLKDAKFGRPEAAGLARLLAGIALMNVGDPARLAQGGAAFDALYEAFRKKP